MLIIGSTAARHWLPDWREPQDLDVIGTPEERAIFVRDYGHAIRKRRPIGDGKEVIVVDLNGRPGHIEWELAYGGNTADWLNANFGVTMRTGWGVYFEVNTPDSAYATLPILLLLKLSHRYLRNSPHFWKTMSDIKKLREVVGVDTPRSDVMQGILKRREDETYDYAHPNLNHTKEEFFTDDVGYIYDHDTIHEAVAIDDTPAYLQYLKPGAEVAVDMNVFFDLPGDVQINGVVEEAAVLTLERSLIPFWLEDGNLDGARAVEAECYRYALAKVCSSITSGKFREFAWENAYIALARATLRYQGDNSLVDRFQRGIETGTILRTTN